MINSDIFVIHGPGQKKINSTQFGSRLKARGHGELRDHQNTTEVEMLHYKDSLSRCAQLQALEWSH